MFCGCSLYILSYCFQVKSNYAGDARRYVQNFLDRQFLNEKTGDIISDIYQTPIT